MTNCGLRLIRAGYLSLLIMLVPLSMYSQSARDVNKSLEKAVKTVSKNPVKIPGLDLDLAGAKGLSLAQAVNEAVDLTLKESLKQDVWDVEGLSTSALLQVETSTTPVSTFFDVSPGSSAFDELLLTNLSDLRVPELIDEMGTDLGFYHSGSTEEFMGDVRKSVLASLDNAAKEQFSN